MTTWRGALTAILSGLGLAAQSQAAALPGAAVTLRYEDRDGCGEPEIVLENAYVQVDLLSGRPPPPLPRTLLDRVLLRPAPLPPPRYNCRFVGPGWIGNVVFKPTGRRWLAQTVEGAEAWRGIPEEFEEAVRIRETSPGVWRCLKIGVGLCEGSGWCTRGSLTLLDAGQWETLPEDLPGGGKAVTFRQTVATAEGYGYCYEKRLLLRPDDSRLVVERRLTNTGRSEWSTTWYTHAFWGQARNGAYDEHCWGTIPLRCGLLPTAGLDTTACPVANPARAYYWGPVDRDLIGAAWYACGTHDGSEVFLNILPDIPAFYRVWTCPQTYSLEPFRLLCLAPGASTAWVETLACGIGLDRLDTHDGVAAYGSVCAPATEDAPARLAIRVVPFRTLNGAQLRAVVRCADGAEIVRTQPVDDVGPDRPFEVALHDLAARLPMDIEIGIIPSAATAESEPLGSRGRLHLAAPDRAPASLPAHANGAGAVILGPFERDAQGGLVPTPAAGMLQEYLAAAGFVPVLARDRDGLPSAGATTPALVACVGLRPLPVPLWRRLEEMVRQGAGLLVCGPIDPAAFEFTDVLPLRAVAGQVRVAAAPRDGTREFVRAYTQRYQLVAAAEHVVLRGLPLFPQGRQDIGVLQVLEPAPQGLTVLRYATPPGLLPEVTSPALVVADYGAGRVAVLASPVDWGVPSGWCLWNRLGEYHRQLFANSALWAAQAALAVPASTPPSSDCGSRQPSE